MKVPGRVAVWEPPHRIVFDGGEGVDGLAFEWLVEARDGGTCIVRLVNSGFGAGGPWDDQYDQMQEGWKLFLFNLQLHTTHFPGQSARAMLPMAMWEVTRDELWPKLLSALGFPEHPVVGERVSVSTDAPAMGGTVVAADSWRLALLLDDPAPGTGIIAAEGAGDQMAISIWSYLYGEAGAAAVERDEPKWSQWLEAHRP